MNRDDLVGLIRSGESSGVEFKRDDVHPERIARELAALLNLEGGHLLLGVEDDGRIAGLSRDRRKAEEWVMEMARTHVRPATIPYWETVEWREGVIVGVEGHGRAMASAAGLLLFGKNPNRYLPHAGVSAAAYAGDEKDYDAKERATLRGPAVSLALQRTEAGAARYPGQPSTFSEIIEWMDSGLVERTLEFVRRNIGLEAWIDAGGRRRERWEYPLEAVREAVVNAVAHRDYTITVSDIELSIYADRMEIISPGRLPNTVTVAKMRAGYRATRNELVKEVLRDYRYVEATGLGVPRKIVRGMREHNGTEPDLIEQDDRFTVRLWKQRAAAARE